MEMKKITMDNIEAVMSAMHAAVNWLSLAVNRLTQVLSDSNHNLPNVSFAVGDIVYLSSSVHLRRRRRQRKLTTSTIT